MLLRLPLLAGLGFVTFLTLAPTGPAAEPGAEVVLRPYVRATGSDLQRVDRGAVLTRTLESRDGREITTFGVIRVRCTIDDFVRRVRDIEHFKAGEYVLQIGRFHASPEMKDVATLTIEQTDRDAMRTCRPGSCAMRLPEAAMEQFRGLPWKNAANPDPAVVAMRHFLVEEARLYLERGSAGLPDYRDSLDSMPRARAFKGLLRPSAFRAEYQPEVFDTFDAFPRGQIEGVESFLYWSREKFGLKPTINITHSVVLRREADAVFASKQVFTSHYLDASLGMSVFVPLPGTPYGYVTYMNRSRVEGLRGPLAGIIRSIAGRRGRDGLARSLQDVRRKLETPATSGPPARAAAPAR